MAINAGVTSTAARNGSINNPKKLAIDLMKDARELSYAVKTIRETLKVVQARGVNLSLYKGEIMPYKIPAAVAGIVMKKMFSANELTSRIMTLHNDMQDIMYGCKCVSYMIKIAFALFGVLLLLHPFGMSINRN